MFFTGIDSQLGKTDDSFKSKKNKVLINENYLIKKIVQRKENYNLYQGIDLSQQRFISIYVKPLSNEASFNKPVKDDYRSKISPPTIWQGYQKIQKITYSVEIHQKFGPSFKQMFSHIKRQIAKDDFIHLFYQLVKLVERIGSGGMVHRQLSLTNIVFDSAPEKNQLYILNIFGLKKKNQECGKSTNKFGSKGSHLGLGANIKDDLQSICYILLDIYSQGAFLKGCKQEEYESYKSSLDPKTICPNIPQIFMDFYYYVMSMNYTDQMNYFHWKNQILKNISKQIITKPYGWMKAEKVEKIAQIQSQKDFPQDIDEQKQNISHKLTKFYLSCKENSMNSKAQPVEEKH